MKQETVMTFQRPLITLTLLGALGGCAQTPVREALPQPLLPPAAVEDDSRNQPNPELPRGDEQSRLVERPTPAGPMLGADRAGTKFSDPLPEGLTGPPVSVNIDNVPLPAFVNELLGEMLGVNFQVSPDVAQVEALVTLRTPKAQTRADLYRLARRVLAEYGVQLRPEGDLVLVEMAKDGARTEPPIILSGTALPDVPVTHRPVFQFLEMTAIRANEAARWLRTVYGTDLSIEEDAGRNALLISGRPDQVRQAIEALQVFDRPVMRGRVSARLEPAFMSANELADRLVEVLVAQGYGATKGLGAPTAILVLPLPGVNSVLVFSQTREVLDHAVNWARELDRPNPAAGNRSVFYHEIKNTRAADIAAILSGQRPSGAPASAVSTAAGGDQAAPPAPSDPATMSAQGEGYTILVDEPRNALIFRGDPAQWERLLPLIRQMDRAARQVMIEVTIAEVTLGDNEEFGVSWLAKGGLDRFNGRVAFGALPATGSGGNSGPGESGSGSTGLTYLLDVAGQSRLLLRAFADDQRVSILSTPRLLVKSGQEASIDVGTEVPTITAQTTAPQSTDGTSNLLQSIQYRKTGIILNVKPTVFSNDRIDLEISQEVSEALPLGDSSSIGSPSIFNRSIKTSLTLRDGGSVILGGLMSQQQSRSESGIPFLKNLPLLGPLFKSQSRRTNKTELVLMIVPYIIGSDERAEDMRNAIGSQLELLELPNASKEAGIVESP